MRGEGVEGVVVGLWQCQSTEGREEGWGRDGTKRTLGSAREAR